MLAVVSTSVLASVLSPGILALAVMASDAPMQECGTLHSWRARGHMYQEQLGPELHAYFDGEKQGGIGFATVGLIALVAVALLWRFGPAHYAALKWPLLVVGLVELGAGLGVYLRTDGQVAKLESEISRRDTSSAAVQAETTRMQKVMTSFAIIKIVELVLLVGGVIVTYTLHDRPVWFAVALGLILQSAAMLAMDLFAEQRARPYVAALERFESR